MSARAAPSTSSTRRQSVPAHYMHSASVPPAANLPQVLDQIVMTDDRSKRRIVGMLLETAAPRTLFAIIDLANEGINKQLAALKWNRLPPPLLSDILSYLSTKQVLQLRRLSRGWNAVGKEASSFNLAMECGRRLSWLERDKPVNDMLTITRAGIGDLSGVRVIAVSLDANTIANWPTGEDESWDLRAPRVQAAYAEILQCLTANDNPCIETFVSTTVVEFCLEVRCVTPVTTTVWARPNQQVTGNGWQGQQCSVIGLAS